MFFSIKILKNLFLLFKFKCQISFLRGVANSIKIGYTLINVVILQF